MSGESCHLVGRHKRSCGGEVGRFPVGVVVHFRDDGPGAVGLAVQDSQGAVVPFGDVAAADEFLAGDSKVGGDQYHFGGEDPDGYLGGRFEGAGVEVLVGEKASEVTRRIWSRPLLTVPKALTQSASAL